MSQQSPIEPFEIEPFEQDGGAVADYRQQAREFLVKSRQYLAEDDLHQASEKGWGAAAWMAKAVAEAQGWKYTRHDEFVDVMYRAQQLSGDARVSRFRARANELHGFFYTRKRFLFPQAIDEGLNEMATLLDILEPLTRSADAA